MIYYFGKQATEGCYITSPFKTVEEYNEFKRNMKALMEGNKSKTTKHFTIVDEKIFDTEEELLKYEKEFQSQFED